MNSFEYRIFLDLLMCSDPWPIHDGLGGEYGQDVMTSLANRVGVDYGYSDWIDAYHKHSA